MDIESVSKSSEEIQGTIINVSFPRSGHRFLREILSGYFGDRFLFHESYTKSESIPRRACEHKNANYVKTHDFELTGRKILFSEFPENRQYLVQIRHPLESIASYYEFSLRHGHIHSDTEAAWHEFLARNLKYWKRFCDTWLLKSQPDSLLVSYDDLCADTFLAADKAIKFLTAQSSLNSSRLTKAIENQEFLQYVGDIESKRRIKRQLGSFKYFDAAEFEKMENALAEGYLQPNRIRLLFQ